jgi:hypothetical protein
MRRRTRWSGERWNRRYRNLKLLVWNENGWWMGLVGSEPLTEIKDDKIRNCFTCRSNAMLAATEMADQLIEWKEQKRKK